MYRRTMSLMAGLSAAALMLLTAASLAGAATPAKGYERFAGCPTQKEAPSVTGCIRSEITGGHFKMGNKDVPISNPIALTGGVNETLGGFAANSEGGLQRVKQQVPGGLIGLTGLDWLVDFLSVEQLKLYAVTELVGQPQVGETLTLPLRVHLVNPALGNACYVGSASAPILLNLISGTTSPPGPNKPITGVSPKFGIDFESEVISFKDGTYVDNSFAAPGANGCKLIVLGLIPVGINGIVNVASGLPSAAGRNETVQDIDIELAPISRVYP